MENINNLIANFNLSSLIEFISTPSFQTFQLVIVIYIGLLWLSVIIWVTRDAIHRSESILFQVLSILLNIIFPILGILLYLIIRPGKTSTERYYEELEHQLILETIKEEEKENEKGKKSTRKKPLKTRQISKKK